MKGYEVPPDDNLPDPYLAVPKTGNAILDRITELAPTIFTVVLFGTVTLVFAMCSILAVGVAVKSVFE